jgi:hypothetical protein
LLHGSGYTLLLTAQGLTLERQHAAPQTIPLAIAGAGWPLQLQPTEPLPGKVNYLLGRDPHDWHTAIPTYDQIVYRNVRPGLDLALSAGSDGLRVIPVQRQGAGTAAVAWMALAHQFAALGWRIATTPERRLARVGQADASAPALSYASYLGTTMMALGKIGIAVDGQGDTYISGTTLSTQFPMPSGTVQRKFGSGSPAGTVFVTKVAPRGQPLYTTYLGASTYNESGGIAVDAQGDVYLTGCTGSADFPVTPGALQNKVGKYNMAFVAELAPGGNRLVYATLLGGSVNNWGSGIAVDSQGAAYVTGSTGSSDFPVTPGAFQRQQQYGGAFVAELAPGGKRLVYATYLGGGAGNDEGNGIAVDTSGNAYVTGRTGSAGFPVTAGAFQTKAAWRSPKPATYHQHAFVAKLAPGGGHLVYATYLGGNGNDQGNGIAVDGQGDAYVAGATSSMDFPVTPSAFQPHYGGGVSDAFVAELTPKGDGLRYATYLGGKADDQGYGIAVDAQGDAYSTGSTMSKNFPVTPGAFQSRYGGGASDAFVTKLAAGGGRLLYSTYLGGNTDNRSGGNLADEIGASIAVDSQNSAYVAGLTSSPNFPVTAGAFQPRYGSRSCALDCAAFVARLIIATTIPPALSPASPPPAGSSAVRYFPATHHSLAGPFLPFWQAHGGVDLLGFPLSQPFTEGGQTVQYTERARLVLAGGRVTLSPLGRLLTVGRGWPPVAPVPQSPTQIYFPATGHTLSGVFLTFWQEHQGSVLFGPPLSEPLREANGDGSGQLYLVQYFANARLEYHPESSVARYQVQLGRLGYEYLHRRGLL